MHRTNRLKRNSKEPTRKQQKEAVKPNTEEMELDTQPNTEPNGTQMTVVEESQEVVKIYGRLYSKRAEIKSLGISHAPILLIRNNPEYIDLISDSFTAGRVNCTYNFPKEALGRGSNLSRISKHHFTIQCDITDDYNPIYLHDHSSNGTYWNQEIIGKNKSRILQNEDIIGVLNPSIKIFQFLDQRKGVETKEYPPNVVQKFFVSRKLGEGACGVVRLVYDVRSCNKFAMKQVKINGLSTRPAQDKSKIYNEVKIMQALEHPCVIKLHDIISSESAIYMILEYMGGGDLLSRIISKKFLPESQAKFYFYQLCHAIKYLHAKDITHRDIKPDNILLLDKDEETLLKVSDFGLSKNLENGTMLRTVCGTPLYVAPEILENKKQGKTYSKKVDIWSLGVVLFTMLSGTLPFSNEYGSPASEQIKRAKFDFRSRVWASVSETAKTLVVNLLQLNPNKRPSIEELMKKSWLMDKDMIRRAHNIMKIDIDNSDSDIENVTLVGMKISDEEEETTPKPPPRKKPRHNL